MEVSVLDRGYVRLVDQMGNELSIVNAARVSFGAESTEWTSKDARLLRYLVEHKHESPMRHVTFTFEISAPLMVARQWFKYRVGGTHGPEVMRSAEYGDEDPGDAIYARNEVSRRYVRDTPIFYDPVIWRTQATDNKQGSTEAGDGMKHEYWSVVLRAHQRVGAAMYADAIKAGIAAEQARLFLPIYGVYTTWRWTASLQAVIHFLTQRLKQDAQYEMRMYAEAVRELVGPGFPNVMWLLFPESADVPMAKGGGDAGK